MQVDTGQPHKDLGIIGEKEPLAPDRAQPTKYKTPTTLSRSSLPTPPPVISRVSAAAGTPGADSPSADTAPRARPALARVSAHDFPNLSRASQLSAGSGDTRRTNLHRSSLVKTEQELARRAAGPVDVGMTITIHDVESGKAVAYKSDGGRFTQSQYTVKMIAGHAYRFVISLNEDYKFTDDSIVLSYMSEKSELQKEGLDCEHTDKGFTVDWTCTLHSNKKGERNNVELMMPLEDYGNCRLSLVVKVYPPNKQRSLAAGNHLKSIILTYRSDNNEVKTIKEAWVDQ